MKTIDAIKFCFTDEVFEIIKKHNSPPEMLKIACLRAFRRGYSDWPYTSPHFQVAQQLKEALTALDETGIFLEE